MEIIRRLYKEFNSFEGSLFKYSLSFSLLLALFPSITVFVMVFNYFNLNVGMIEDFLFQYAPEDLIAPFMEFIVTKEFSNITSIVISLCLAFWLASRSIYSFLLVNASKEDVWIPKWIIRIKSIILFIFLLLSVVVAITICNMLDGYIQIASIISMFIISYTLFRFLSFKKKSYKYGILGSLFTTIGLLIVAYIFYGIVATFTNYESIYGPLSSFLILTLAIYVVSSIIYFGFCLNIIFDDNKYNELKSNRGINLLMNISNSVKSFISKLWRNNYED